MSNPVRVATAFVLVVIAASAARSQNTPNEDRPSWVERRMAASIGGWAMQPAGELAKNIGAGIGIGGAGLLRLDDMWSLRADLGIGGYGHESKRVPLSSTIGGRVQVDVNTTNYIAVGAFGPQLSMPRGPVRPYVNAGVALQGFFTQSDVDGADDDHSFANTTNQSDFTPALSLGGGVYVLLHSGRVPVLLDLGVTSFTGGRAEYLKPGSIEDLPDNQIRIKSMESATPFFLLRIGVKIGQ